MKLPALITPNARFTMPPSRGHDLKLRANGENALLSEMPPSRGHDLKRGGLRSAAQQGDAPLAGA